MLAMLGFIEFTGRSARTPKLLGAVGAKDFWVKSSRAGSEISSPPEVCVSFLSDLGLFCVRSERQSGQAGALPTFTGEPMCEHGGHGWLRDVAVFFHCADSLASQPFGFCM